MKERRPSSSLTGPGNPVTEDIGLLDVQEPVVQAEIVLEGEGRDPGPYPRGTFVKIGSGIAVLVAAIIATYLVPVLHFARPWTTKDPVPYWNLIGREILGEGESAEQKVEEVETAQAIAQVVAQEEEEAAPIEDRAVVEPAPDDRLPAYQPHPDDEEEVPRELELGAPTDLDAFYERLARTEAGYAGAITRVVHWGDSVIASDNVTSTLRQQMQRRFGDAGHGFHLLTKPNASYKHRGIRFTADAWSKCYIINKCRDDGRYGLGGTTVWSAGGGQSWFATATSTSYGRKVSRMEVWYLAQPGGGKIRIKVDDGDPEFVSTLAEEAEDRWHVIQVPDGAHELQVRAAGEGKVRLYGVVFERDVPGVVWDGMAQLGAFANRMLHFDPAHLEAQIAHRDPALLVFQFGGNDLQIRKSQLPTFRKNFAEVLRRFRSSNPTLPCLVVSPADHGYREGGRIISHPMVPEITQAEREVALAEGCAFFDTYSAMGGDGSAARWRRSHPPLLAGDLAHLSDAGQKVIGRMIYLALMKGYRDYRARTDG